MGSRLLEVTEVTVSLPTLILFNDVVCIMYVARVSLYNALLLCSVLLLCIIIVQL